MKDISERELLKKLESLDDETLKFITEYSAEKRKLARTSALISSALASIVGFAIFAGFLFPEADKLIIAAVSIFIGIFTVVLSVFERKKQELKLVSKLLRNSRSENVQSLEKDQREQLIEKFIKSGGL